jgi:hypothetical protein
MIRAFVIGFLSLALPGPAYAQSQATDGSIEGIVVDTSGGALPGVTVTLTNIATGAERVVVSNDSGLYRAPLLRLGLYRIKAELSGFKSIERTGVTLSAGQSAVVNFELPVGGVQEVVQVSAEPPIAEPGKIDFGRTITTTEFKNLPLVSRNTFNFGLLQPNVTGYEDVEFGATRVNANGSQMRTNYQIDGSSATQKNRAGLRMFQPSEIMVQEVKVTSSGFAPEFGQTTGMVYNVITPSGTNQIQGDGSYRLRRKDFAARPFTLPATAPTPDTHVNDVAGTVGGPIVKDRLHFFVGYEYLKHDLSADRVITVTPETAATLGLSSGALGSGVIPALQTVNMFVGKADAQLNRANRFSARWSVFNNKTPENILGGLNTREIANDFQDRMDNVGVQLTTTIGNAMLNEFRFAYGRRNNPLVQSAAAGPGPSVTITGVASFNGVRYAAGTTPVFLENFEQIVDNVSWIRGRHDLKVGMDAELIHDDRGADITALYTFPDIASYLAAKNGTNRFGYTRFDQNVGDPSLTYDQRYWSFFAQDDFRITPQFKLLFGVRYDLFKVPVGDPTAPLAISRTFRTDKNNVAPRAGVAWSLDPESRTVVRASTGLMYETPLGAFYENALLLNGNPRFLPVSAAPTAVGAPAFPGTLSSLPPGVVPSKSILTVASDFNTQYAWLSNLQVERALSNDLSVAAAYVNSTGRNLPVALSVNAIPTGATLPDGRPIYASAISPSTRLDPNFDVIRQIQSIGRSKYDALTLSMTKRQSHGFLMNAFYTLAKAQDNGVIGGTYVIGSTDQSGISDPSNLDRDYGYTAFNQTHTFVLSTVFAPTVSGNGLGAMLANNNQVGVVVQANSGLPYNIRSNRDLNLDGITDADRLNGVARNSGTLGTFATVDLRYSRFVPLSGARRVEAFAELKNLLNHKNIKAVNSVVPTDTAGNPLAPIPSPFPLTATYEARQFQLGFKVSF